jgi:hypothetical protein
MRVRCRATMSKVIVGDHWAIAASSIMFEISLYSSSYTFMHVSAFLVTLLTDSLVRIRFFVCGIRLPHHWMAFLLPGKYIARLAHYRHPLLPFTGFIPRQSSILVNFP